MSSPVQIGVFDSGFGGLPSLKLCLKLSRRQYLYFGDTARLPYGSKSVETVAKYACRGGALSGETGRGAAGDCLQHGHCAGVGSNSRRFIVQVVGVVEPGAQGARRRQTRKVAVIGTEATVSAMRTGERWRRVRLSLPRESLPPAGAFGRRRLGRPSGDRAGRENLSGRGFRDRFQSADVLLLGCTHYPLLKQVLHRSVPENVTLVDFCRIHGACGSEPGEYRKARWQFKRR